MMFRGIDSWCKLCGEWRWHCLVGGLEFGCVCGRGVGVATSCVLSL